jgi:spermidine/putrescine transport system permease protein
VGFLHRNRQLTPYLLLAPGLLWLGVFFVVPLGFLAYQSLQSGNFDIGYSFTWAWGNYWTAIHDYRDQFIRSLEYAGIATVLALVVATRLRTGSRFAAAAGRTSCCCSSWRRSSSRI